MDDSLRALQLVDTGNMHDYLHFIHKQVKLRLDAVQEHEVLKDDQKCPVSLPILKSVTLFCSY